MVNLQDVWGEDVIHLGYFSMQISLILSSPQFLGCHSILEWVSRQANCARVEWTIFKDPPRSVMSEVSFVPSFVAPSQRHTTAISVIEGISMGFGVGIVVRTLYSFI
jgi:uncharacterized membrane-anchored protein YitT (DUF2179 family)